MPTQTLQDQFFSTLVASRSYQLMSPEEQKELAERYNNATDEQLQAALDELKASSAEIEKVEAEVEKHGKEQSRLSAEIRTDLASLKKIEVREMSQQEAEQSSQKADKLIEGIAPKKEGFFTKLIKALHALFSPHKK